MQVKTIQRDLEISGLSYGDVLTMQTAKRSDESTRFGSARVALNNSEAVQNSKMSVGTGCSVLKRSFAEISKDAEGSKDTVSIFGKPRAPFTWVCALCRTFKSQDEQVVQEHEKMCKDVMK